MVAPGRAKGRDPSDRQGAGGIMGLCAPGCARPGTRSGRQARDRIRAPGPGPPGGEDAERIKECEKEVRQLRRASAILKERVGLSIAAECGRPSR